MPGRAWFGQGLIYDEVYGILQDLSILDKPDQKKSVDGPGAGQTPNAGWFNRLVNVGVLIMRPRVMGAMVAWMLFQS